MASHDSPHCYYMLLPDSQRFWTALPLSLSPFWQQRLKRIQAYMSQFAVVRVVAKVKRSRLWVVIDGSDVVFIASLEVKAGICGMLGPSVG